MGQDVRRNLIFPFIILLTAVCLLASCGELVENGDLTSGTIFPPYRPPARAPFNAASLTGSIDYLVSGFPEPVQENFNVFSSYSATPGQANLSATWNPDCWGAHVNLSPIAWHDTWTLPNGTGGPTLGHGVAISRRHVLAHHQHGTEVPGMTLQFVRKNGEIITRQAAYEYEVDTSTFWRILWLDEDLPEDMVAPLPTSSSNITNKPIANLNQFRELRLQYVYAHSASGVNVNFTADPDPTRRKYFRAPIGGDSGKPLFGIIGSEIIPLSVWWTTGGGSSVVYHQAGIVEAMNRLSTTKGDARMLQPRFVEVK